MPKSSITVKVNVDDNSKIWCKYCKIYLDQSYIVSHCETSKHLANVK